MKRRDDFWSSWRMLSKIGCAECDYTGYMEASDGRIYVSWPCDCRKKATPAETEEPSK